MRARTNPSDYQACQFDGGPLDGEWTLVHKRVKSFAHDMGDGQFAGYRRPRGGEVFTLVRITDNLISCMLSKAESDEIKALAEGRDP